MRWALILVVASGLAPTAAYDPLMDRLAPEGFSFTPPSRTAHSSCLDPTDPGCKLQCRPHDPVLERALAPWWDVKLDPILWRKSCDTVGGRWGQGYLGRISNGELWYKRCSTGDDEEPVEDLMLLFGVLLQLAEEIGLPDLEFTFNTGDQPFTDRSYWAPVPQLHWVHSEGHWSIPMPNPYHLNAHWSNRLGDAVGMTGSQLEPMPSWDDRQSIAYWRGSLSVPDNTPYTAVQGTPRIRLMRLSKQYPDLFDVGLASLDQDVWWDQWSYEEQQKFDQAIQTVSFQSFEEASLKVKFVINVGAVLSSWRLAEMLATGAVMLLQMDSTSEMLQGYLQPWVHFVPINFELSDLVPKIKYLIENDDVAAKIAAAGFEFFQKRVRRSDTHCYMLQLMRALHNMTGSPSDNDLTGFQRIESVSVFEHLNERYGPVDKLHEVLAKQPQRDEKDGL